MHIKFATSAVQILNGVLRIKLKNIE